MRTAYFEIPESANIFDITKECLLSAVQVNCDELDCSKSLRRKPTSFSAKNILKLAETNSYYFSFVEHENMGELLDCNYFVLACLSTFASPEYFLWIYLSLEDGRKIAEKYNLTRVDCRVNSSEF